MTTFLIIIAILYLWSIIDKRQERIKKKKEAEEREKLLQAELDERIENHPDLYLQTKAYYQQGERAKISLEVSNLSKEESKYVRDMNQQYKKQKITNKKYQEALRMIVLEKLQWYTFSEKEKSED